MLENCPSTWVEFTGTGVLTLNYTSRQDLSSTFPFADKGSAPILQADVLHVSGGTRIGVEPLSFA